ncbi:hypothetical protein [Streptomyces sp. MMBL 11-3]|uniref:hypothetical protein n=1 Tax=Streptomyces sp. MMBL 11-3 TaxID=3382639 RepID=UPI0039B42968
MGGSAGWADPCGAWGDCDPWGTGDGVCDPWDSCGSRTTRVHCGSWGADCCGDGRLPWPPWLPWGP